jgi:hypothetical protein
MPYEPLDKGMMNVYTALSRQTAIDPHPTALWLIDIREYATRAMQSAT